MTGPDGWTVAEVQAGLLLAARVIITDHWPVSSAPDRCPVCRWVWPCQPTRLAYAYLRLRGAGLWVPPHVRAGG